MVCDTGVLCFNIPFYLKPLILIVLWYYKLSPDVVWLANKREKRSITSLKRVKTCYN